MKRKIYIFLAAYFVFLFTIAIIATPISDEGTNALLSVFYSEAAKHFVSNPSIQSLYDFGISFLVHYPKITVYYPPLQQFFTGLLFQILGASMLVARLGTIIVVVTGLYLFYFMQRKIGINENSSLLSTIIVSSALPFIYFAHGALTDAQVVLFSASGILSYYYATLKKSDKWFYISAVITAIGFWIKWQAILVLLISGLYIEIEKRNQIKPFAKSLIIFAVIVLPYMLYIHSFGLFDVIVLSSGYGGNASTPILEPSGLLFYITSIVYDYFSIPLALVLLYLSLSYLHKREESWKLFAIWIIVMYLVFTIIPNKQGRYFMPVLPAIAITAAMRADKLLSKWDWKKIAFGLLLVLNFCLFFVSTPIVSSYYIIPSFENYDYQIAQSILQQPQGDVLLATESPKLQPGVMMFYLASADYSGKVFRACSSENPQKFATDNGVSYIVDVDNSSDIALQLADSFSSVNVYRTGLHNTTNCNYVCITNEWVCSKR